MDDWDNVDWDEKVDEINKLRHEESTSKNTSKNTSQNAEENSQQMNFNNSEEDGNYYEMNEIKSE